jgi:hypothetical protein
MTMKMKNTPKVFVDWLYLYKNFKKVSAIQDQETFLRILTSEKIGESVFNLREKFSIPTHDGYGGKSRLNDKQSKELMQEIRKELLAKHDISDRWLFFVFQFVVHGFKYTMDFASTAEHDEMSVNAIKLLCRMEQARQRKEFPKASEHPGKYSVRENEVQIDEKNNKVIITLDASSPWAELNAMKPLIEQMQKHLKLLHPQKAKKRDYKDFPSTKRNILLCWCYSDGFRKPKDVQKRMYELSEQIGLSMYDRKDFEPQNLEQQMKRIRDVIKA